MLRFSVLASGSAGNAALLQAGEFGLLIDAGLGPRQIAARLASIGSTWESVHLVLLTHTHGDHWRERTLAHMARRQIPLCCHPRHADTLATVSDAFLKLQKAGLIRTFERDAEVRLHHSLQCKPVEVSHDSTPTFAFRFWGPEDLFGETWSLGFLSDLGCWSPALVDAFRNVGILALEFNHDEAMERQSLRSAELIERVLGDFGHLSNDQAAAFLSSLLRTSTPGILQHLVQLHLSRDCNKPALALRAAARVCAELAAAPKIHTASQDVASPILTLEPLSASRINEVPQLVPAIEWSVG